MQALEINARYRYSYWDSLIIATALQSDCRILYSEDMQHNHLIEDKLRIINSVNLEVLGGLFEVESLKQASKLST